MTIGYQNDCGHCALEEIMASFDFGRKIRIFNCPFFTKVI